ncbi:MAG TPA: DUF4932 domain-containing protein [Verrucomicrobiota bacterium]|nr:DUF4932 domain-containing protein [Verrucomicrobiota bacterium]
MDPRVELLSLLFRLAGNPEYNQGKVESYLADAEKQFGTFRDHPVVQFARELRQRRGVSYDACMSMAVHLSMVDELKLLPAQERWPEALDKRWTATDVSRFLELSRQFVRDTAFLKFLEAHSSLYGTTEFRMKALMDKEGHLEWFNAFFGEKPQAMFVIAPALFNGGCCYGPRRRDSAGNETLYCILGVWKTAPDGLPEFTPDMLETVVHEFAHSYANPIVDRHRAELQSAGNTLFRSVSAQMRSQAYGDSQTMLRESLVRACEVRYTFRYRGAEAARRSVTSQKSRGFLWMEELSDLLAQYEEQREQYPTLDSFSPRLVAFFRAYAADFAQKQKAAEGSRPKVLSMKPANGDENADPNLSVIQVVFDRPMKDRSWSPFLPVAEQCSARGGTANWGSV